MAGSGIPAVRAGYREARTTVDRIEHAYILRFGPLPVHGSSGPWEGYGSTRLQAYEVASFTSSSASAVAFLASFLALASGFRT